MKEVLHFAHGNGFPSPCYKQLLQCLERRFDCYYIDRVGHNPDFPVTENWQCLVDEVLTSIKEQASEPVVAVGHSLGGVLSLLAAIEEPALFKALVLLDSPLIGRLKSWVIRFSKRMGYIDRVTPAFRTEGRQRHWQSREAVWTYLKSRALFKTFTDACLNDYIDYGMQRSDNGYSLRFEPAIEYQIYCTIPHILHQHEGKLRVPTTLIYGDTSDVIGAWERHYMKKHYGIIGQKIQGTHMFPMECPEAVAACILHMV